ncbi:isoflavone-7-O-methyltransferase 6-like [Neltuma alba]|uniref:isoflavone-7-O-methyltransferase 6-like n=1 Tax=Neltuma alba TaxID=207710 RepID=UPI0010A2F526|nr:isoflavone-7-O-methyltransferase 6-like [Prosopis alba]
MGSDTRFMKLALIRDLESVLDGLGSIVDVGGGNGATAKIISEAFPKLKCTVLDLPEVVANLSGNANLSFVGGDMLKSIPHADAVLIKWVLLDWGDDDCIKILKNAKRAISGKGNEGKVIIIDMVLDEKHDQYEWLETKLLINIALIADLNSKARSEEEWKQVFLKAGFKDYKIFPIFGLRSLIVLHP